MKGFIIHRNIKLLVESPEKKTFYSFSIIELVKIQVSKLENSA